MRRSYILPIFFLALLVVGCKEKEASNGNIAGQVSDSITDEPISGAEITLNKLSLESTSAVDGSFGFKDIPVGTYNIEASMAGFADSKKAVTIQSGQTTEVQLTMERYVPSFTPSEVSLNNNKQSKSVEIMNGGDGTLNLSFTSSQSWITLDQAGIALGPQEKMVLEISVDLSSIDYGEYEEEVMVTFDGYSFAIPVTVNYDEQVDIVWQNWYLSVPIDNGSGKATSIFYEDIINDNLTTEEKEYFHYDDATGSYVLWTHFTGLTTSGTYPLDGGAYCRTELREFWQGNQTTDDNWYMNPGETHLLESTLNVDYCEGNGRTFVAQIHGKKSTDPSITNGPATVKVLWDDGDIEVEYYVKPPDPTGEWTSQYNAKSEKFKVDNEIFTIKLKVVDGVLSWALECEAKGINTDFVDLFDYASNGYHYNNYFKTGNYFQWKSDYDQSSQVRIYKVATTHY